MSYSHFYEDTHPLLERFRSVAPASLKHCQNVASMCATVASSLPQVNKELLHVAALYHDVGKLLSAQYFCENQIGEDLHKDLPPRVSYEIITRHVSDSAALLVAHDFPPEVIKVILQHHGTSVVRYFQQKDLVGDEENFRYKWSVPDNLEAAILMIADVVEATAKSYFTNGKLTDDHETFIAEIIDRLVEDGQLDILNYGVARVIKKQLPRELESLYHKRVDYEETKKEGKKNGASKTNS